MHPRLREQVIRTSQVKGKLKVQKEEGAERKPVLLAHDVWHKMRGHWTSTWGVITDHRRRRWKRQGYKHLSFKVVVQRQENICQTWIQNLGTEYRIKLETLSSFDSINRLAVTVVVETTIYQKYPICKYPLSF